MSSHPAAATRRGGPRWRGTLLYVPVLYAVGWLLARPLALLVPGLRSDQVDLAGAAVALGLLLATLPWRLRRAWGVGRPWKTLGVAAPPAAALAAWLRGVALACVLLGLVAAGLLLSGSARPGNAPDGGEVLNALALLVGVGFAEELLFRGWLWGELEQEVGTNRALPLQGFVFALVHPWYHLPAPGALSLLGGLTLLGMVLARRRRADGGILWGAVGLHGGLVGGWFVLQAGPLQILPGATALVVGPGAAAPNPLGGAIGLVALAGLLMIGSRRHAASVSREPGSQ